MRPLTLAHLRDESIEKLIHDVAATLKERSKVRAIGGEAKEYVFTRFGKRQRDIRTAFDKTRTDAWLGDDVTFHM